jgi:hypothetical protein
LIKGIPNAKVFCGAQKRAAARVEGSNPGNKNLDRCQNIRLKPRYKIGIETNSITRADPPTPIPDRKVSENML